MSYNIYKRVSHYTKNKVKRVEKINAEWISVLSENKLWGEKVNVYNGKSAVPLNIRFFPRKYHHVGEFVPTKFMGPEVHNWKRREEKKKKRKELNKLKNLEIKKNKVKNLEEK